MKAQAREILDQYLESNLHRKTPERYAILDAVFSMRGHFTLEELGAALERMNFRVSRATLYNTIHLFLELRLVVRHSLVDGTKYEASSSNENHVLTDFINTGTYDISDREFILTSSPSMDILVSSNLERQLFQAQKMDAIGQLAGGAFGKRRQTRGIKQTLNARFALLRV